MRDWQSQYDLGVRYLNEGNYEEAIIAFSAAIKIDPKRAPAYVGRGDAYVGMLDTDIAQSEQETYYENAIQDYTSGLELDNQQAETYLKLANVYLSREDEENALRILEQGYEATKDTDILDQLHQLGGLADTEPVIWTDPTLERMVREKIGRTEGDVQVQELDDIYSLNIYGDNFIYINGEEASAGNVSWRHCDGLTGELTAFYGTDAGDTYTSRGSIANIDSLRYFRNLDNLIMIANSVTDISVVESMHLTFCNVWGNMIADLSPLNSVAMDDENTAEGNAEQFVQLGDRLPIPEG